MTPTIKRLMIVDDEVEICNFVKSFFEDRGFEVAQAHDREQALKVAHQVKPHIILLDLKMKEANDGFEILTSLKNTLPETRFLMVTGNDDEECVKRGKELGAEDYITKPLKLSYLEDTVLKKIKDLEKAS